MFYQLKLIFGALRSNLEAKTIMQIVRHGGVILTVIFVDYWILKTIAALPLDQPAGVKPVLTWVTSAIVLILSGKFTYLTALRAVKEVNEERVKSDRWIAVAALFLPLAPLAFQIPRPAAPRPPQASIPYPSPSTPEIQVIDVPLPSRGDAPPVPVCPSDDRFRLRLAIPTRQGYGYLSQLGEAHRAALVVEGDKVVTGVLSRESLAPGPYKLTFYEYPQGNKDRAKPVTTVEFDLCR
jgi:hypothetical protein